jgi:hypothetical protein
MWIVVDQTWGSERDRTTTTWTGAANLRLHTGEFPASYIFEEPGQQTTLSAFLINSTGATPRIFRGSLDPFAGWQVIGGIPREAPALVMEQPARESWSVSVWTLSDGKSSNCGLISPPSVRGNVHQDQWTISLPSKSGLFKVRRQGEEIVVWRPSVHEREALSLAAPTDVSSLVYEVHQRLRACAERYPKFFDLIRFRLKATYWLLFIAVLQEVFFFIYRMWKGTHLAALRALAILVWAGLSVWLFAFYFQVG